VGFEINPVQDLSVALSLFQIDMEDEISWNELTFRNENLDDTRHRGIEIFTNYDLEGIFDLEVNYTYQESTFENGPNKENDIPLVPNNLLTANLDLTLPHAIHLITGIQFVDDSYLSQDFDNTTEKLDGYTVVDIMLRYKKNIGQTQVTAFFKIANLFDEEYSTHGTDGQGWGDNTFFPSPGRKFYGGISAIF
jgi:iron complex outermembrane receptor protein